MDFYEDRQTRAIQLVKAALAEAGWPNATVWADGPFTLRATTDEPGHPPFAVVDKAMRLANEAYDMTLTSARLGY